ncbi:TonB C-terminal domain-containing protein [Rhodoplanes azumiensis]|uniref:TonB C-terminal domain-containing protein n=1 Tax=Rhodoplanes azumiensis TaxID=1897628 RepID=A0ABW5ANM1_9BRAD
MARRYHTSDDSGRSGGRGRLLAVGTGLVVLLLLGAGVAVLLSGDPEPPRKVQDLTVVAILPPPPPPPPPPEREPPPPEQKVVEQTPVKQEIIEEKPVEIPKEAPPDDTKSDAPPDGPLGLDDAGKGPGDLLGRPGGRGIIGGGGGGGGGGTKWGWYAAIVQSQIEAALRANERTRYAVMQVQVRLWSDGTGRVNRVQLVSSTGNPELDAVIQNDVLGRLTLREPPPRDMPMPIITRVMARRPT